MSSALKTKFEFCLPPPFLSSQQVLWRRLQVEKALSQGVFGRLDLHTEQPVKMSREMASSMKKPMLCVAPDKFEFVDVELNKPLTEYLSLTNNMDEPMTVSLRL